MGYKKFKDIRKDYNLKIISKNYMKIQISNLKFTKMGRPTFLLPDEEALFVAAAEMRGLAAQPQTRRRRLAIQLSKAITSVVSNKRDCEINYKSQLQYCRRLICRVNDSEPEAENQKKEAKQVR